MHFFIQGFLFFAFTFLYAANEALVFNKSAQQQVDESGFADVIVTINTSSSLSTTQLNSLSGTKRTSAVFGMQKGLLSALPQGEYTVRKQYKYTPQIHMKVNQKVLEQLEKNQNITVSINRMHRPSLVQSIPRVFPSHSSSPYDGNNTWAVAVLDTGVDKTHPFLSGKVVSEACYSTGGYGSDPIVSSFCPNNASSSTASGSGINCDTNISGCDHGTHVAGIAVGNGTNYNGMAKNGKIIAIQVFTKITDTFSCLPYSSPCITAFTSDLINGLERVYALRNTYNIAAVNMSLGGGSFSGACNSEAERPIIQLLKSANIATIVASGNGSSTNSISSPACITESIAVGSTLDTSDQRSSFSNSSSMLDLYAPGSSITSSILGGGYGVKSGTSMATPHVAGAWVLARHANKCNTTVDQIENFMKQSGVDVTVNGVTRKRINVDQVLSNIVNLNTGCTTTDDNDEMIFPLCLPGGETCIMIVL